MEFGRVDAGGRRAPGFRSHARTRARIGVRSDAARTLERRPVRIGTGHFPSVGRDTGRLDPLVCDGKRSPPARGDEKGSLLVVGIFFHIGGKGSPAAEIRARRPIGNLGRGTFERGRCWLSDRSLIQRRWVIYF